MLTRIALMFVIVASLCGASFKLGAAASGLQQDPSGIPDGHPVMLALQHKSELNLTDEQAEKLNALHDEMAKAFAPLREQAQAIQKRMQELQQSENPDPATAEKLKAEGDALGAKMQPVFEQYAQEVGKLLTDEQRQKLSKIAKAAEHPGDGPEFVLDTIMHSREQLAITPQQFTKLQYLLADFIRAFAPVREKMELLQLEVQDKFGKEGKPPTSDYTDRAAELQKQVAALQAQYSGQAVKDVLEPTQRTKLEELLNGEHRAKPAGE